MTALQWGFAVEKKGQTEGLIDQVHGADLLVVPSQEKISADAVVTYQRRLPVYVFTADCLPVLLHSFEPTGPIAAIHAGWRGAMKGIVSRVLGAHFDSNTRAILGPCIRACCFEVKSDFVDQFSKQRGSIEKFLDHREGRTYFDLVSFVIEQELKELSKERIDLASAQCTYCGHPQLPSYRRNGSTDVRIRAWIVRD